MLDAERGAPDANIAGFDDALWWGVTTITTVGYGDQFPVTDQGRLIAVALMLTGIALLGIVTATIASWFIERLGGVEETTQREVDAVLREVEALRRGLGRERVESVGADKTGPH